LRAATPEGLNPAAAGGCTATFAGGGAGTDLSENLVNAAMRLAWEQSQGRIDTIVVGGFQKRRINSFVASNRRFDSIRCRFASMPSDSIRRMIIVVFCPRRLQSI
jgi:hypothetical protein